ncbi:Phosphate regulon sensor protein phoR [Rickettsiales bacterium Ac37b]|nr:Phosphate regulon sensor protein phoR [Rickettsiales bacterium Ac37b]
MAFVSLAAPLAVLIIYLLYGKLTLIDLIGWILISLPSILLLLRPYINDLNTLTKYVEKLSHDHKVKPPYLPYLSNIENLSSAISKLNTSWQNKQVELESFSTENQILVDNLPDIILIINDEMDITRANCIALTTFGLDIVGKNINHIISNNLLLSFIKWSMHDRHLKTLEVALGENSTEPYYIVRIKQFPLINQDKISVMVSMTNITNSKRTELLLTDFIANVSHEIRTPLTSLKGFIEILQTTAKDDFEIQEKFLKIMGEQVQRLTMLVNNLLSLSKAEMNVNILPSTQIDIIQAINTVIDETYGSRKSKNLDILFHTEDHIPLITADYGQMIQLFTNLIGNSIKYAHSNSTITISLKLLKAIPTELMNIISNAKSLIEISIKDISDGIEEKHIPRLTERFYMVNQSRQTGTGLGLSIVKQIIARHQGNLKIESTIGEGSIFTIYLPVEYL